MALVGLWYRQELARYEADPGEASGEETRWTLQLDEMAAADEKGCLAAYMAEDVQALLTAQGLVLDEPTRERLAERMFWSKVKLCNTLSQRVRGNYAPDPHLASFPAWKPPGTASATSLTFNDLLDGWALETSAQKKTRDDWGGKFQRLGEFLGHSSPAQLTAEDAVRWKEHALGKLGAITVRNYLHAFSAVLNWGVENKRIPANPFAGIRVRAKKAAGTKKLPFTDDEAALILQEARKLRGAKRWVPWILAFTGARLDEACQLLTSDVRTEEGVTYLDLNADFQKRLKTEGSARQIPVHPILIREGFLEFVASHPANAPIFPDITPDRYGRRAGNGTKVFGRWVRGLGITDKRKAPNHAWRHRFKDVCRKARIPKDVQDALLGHKSGDVGDSYGEGFTVRTLAEWMKQVPSPLGHG